MPWLRFWTDILDSEKIAELDDATYRGWTLILIAAKKHDQDGLLPPLKRIAYWTRRTETEVKKWIETLKRAGLIDAGKDGPRVHDWDYWQEPKDRTNARRQKEFRVRKKGSLDSPKTESETENRGRADETVTPLPLRPRYAPVTPPLRNDPVTASNAVTHPLPAQSEAETSLISLAAERWGASSGDAVVADLLRTFEPGIVGAAMDRHYDKHKTNLKPALLRGTCQGMVSDGWKPDLNGSAAPRKPETPLTYHTAPPNWKGAKPT